MDEVLNTEAAASVAAPVEQQPLDLLGAAALFAEREAQTKQAEQPAPEPEQAAAEEAPPESETPQDEPAREAEPEEPQPLDWENLHGNTLVTLRDGTKLTVGQIKKDWAEVQELKNTRSAFSQEQQRFQQAVQQFQASQAQLQQQAAAFAQAAPVALAALQNSLPQVPPLPERTLAATDPFAYNEQLAAHLEAKNARDTKLAEMQHIQRAAYEQQIRAKQQMDAQQAQVLQANRKALLDKNPEFADPGKADEFKAKFTRYGQEVYGFDQQELGGVVDARAIQVMKDAIAYRELMAAQKPKPVAQSTAKPAASAPVQQPGRRATGGEAKAVQRQQLFQNIRQNSNDLRAIAELASKAGIA